MRTTFISIFSGKSARIVKRISVGLEIFEFGPKNVSNIVYRFIVHIQVETGLFVQFHHNLLNLQMTRSYEPIYCERADFEFHRKGPGCNCIVMYQIIALFIP